MVNTDLLDTALQAENGTTEELRVLEEVKGVQTEAASLAKQEQDLLSQASALGIRADAAKMEADAAQQLEEQVFHDAMNMLNVMKNFLSLITGKCSKTSFIRLLK